MVRDSFGGWWVSRAGWGERGLFVAPLTWHDGFDSESSSMPTPQPPAPRPNNFTTNLQALRAVGGGGDLRLTPSGLAAGWAMGDAFFMAPAPKANASASFVYRADITLVTKDGNPTNAPGLFCTASFSVHSFASSNLCILNFELHSLGSSNPLSGPYSRFGSAAALIFNARDYNNPLGGCYAANIFTDHGGGELLLISAPLG